MRNPAKRLGSLSTTPRRGGAVRVDNQPIVVASPSETDWLEHPAVKAWNELRQVTVLPEGIESLKPKGRPSAVYRLKGVGPSGANVIAKRCPLATAMIERTIYEEVLPYLPMPALSYYGFGQDENPRFGWLFVEDAGDELFSCEVPEHRVLLSRWLGALH